MLANITQNHGIYFNSTPKQNRITKDKKYELFNANQPEETAEIKKSANFSDIPQEALNVIGNFLGTKDILNKILPLSKKIFEAVIEDRFKLKIPTQEGHILEIGYKEFLSNQVLILKDRIENDPRHGRSPLATWKKLHFARTIICNSPNSLYQNYSFNNNSVSCASFIISIHFESLLFFMEYINRNYHVDLTDIRIRTHITAIVLIIISIIYFIINERVNPHLLPTPAQRNLIEQRASAAHAQKKLPELEHHLEELMTLFDAQ
jgi:hypothetical protein